MNFITCETVKELGIAEVHCCASCHDDHEDGYDDEMFGIYLDQLDPTVKWEDARLVGSLCCGVSNAVDLESGIVKKKLLDYVWGTV